MLVTLCWDFFSFFHNLRASKKWKWLGLLSTSETPCEPQHLVLSWEGLAYFPLYNLAPAPPVSPLVRSEVRPSDRWYLGLGSSRSRPEIKIPMQQFLWVVVPGGPSGGMRK